MMVRAVGVAVTVPDPVEEGIWEGVTVVVAKHITVKPDPMKGDQ